MLKSSTLRQIWLINEETPDQLILELSDSDLVQQIQNRLEARGFLEDAEQDTNTVRAYIYSRLPLFRDLALSRLICPLNSEQSLVPELV